MIKTYVNEEKRTVCAVIEGCEFDAITKIVKRNPDLTFENIIDEETFDFKFGLENALISNKYVATAKCHPDDTFDAETGRKIAREKVAAKVNAAVNRAVDRWVKHQIKILLNNNK